GIYALLVLGGLAGMSATLTAPGIAGLILSIGMAVDANVLIFERIREELALGRPTRAAVDDGFKHAMSAIVDSNLTTLITALILFQVGTGPVRGFAVTLSIGIIASFFSAVFITRTFFLIYLDRKRASDAISICGAATMRLFEHANFDFVGKRKTFFVISALTLLVFVAGAVYFQIARGSWLNYSVDFTGGTLVQARIAGETDIGDLRPVIDQAVPGSEITA